MKISITKTSLFIILLALTFTVKAQGDYVVTVGGDSIACKLSMPLFGALKYQSATMSVPKKITPDEIREYYSSDDQQLYRAVYPTHYLKPTYLSVIENGRISLYEATNRIYNSTNMITTTTTTWYIGKGTAYVKDVKSNTLFASRSRNERKDDFAEMLKDNKNVYDKYQAEDKYSFEQIRKLIHLYNQGFPNTVRPFDIPKKDYVIKNNKDTVFCEVEPATMNTIGRYRISELDKFTKIDTSITEYFLAENSSTYLLKNLPKNSRRQYVKLLVKGRINLYSYSTNNSTADSEASLYAAKEPGDMVKIKHAFSSPDKYEKKALTDLISDDPNLVKKNESLPYDYRSIVDYIKMYDSEYLNNSKPIK